MINDGILFAPALPEFSGKNSWMYVSFWSCQIFREKNPTWTELTCYQEFNFNNQGLTEVLKLDNLGLTVKGMSKLSLNLWQDEKNTQLTPVYLSTWFVCQQSWIRNQLITQCIYKQMDTANSSPAHAKVTQSFWHWLCTPWGLFFIKSVDHCDFKYHSLVAWFHQLAGNGRDIWWVKQPLWYMYTSPWGS